MTDVFVLGTGPSLTQSIVDSVRGRGIVVSVSNAYQLAPWAEALVSTDAAWWNHYNPVFDGKKYCPNLVDGTIRVSQFPPHENSGVLACRVAREFYNPTRICLLGFDFGGGHFFGDHPQPLQNTKPERFSVFQEQFRIELHRCEQAGIQLINCTENSQLKKIPKLPLSEFLDSKHA